VVDTNSSRSCDQRFIMARFQPRDVYGIGCASTNVDKDEERDTTVTRRTADDIIEDDVVEFVYILTVVMVTIERRQLSSSASVRWRHNLIESYLTFEENDKVSIGVHMDLIIGAATKTYKNKAYISIINNNISCID